MTAHRRPVAHGCLIVVSASLILWLAIIALAPSAGAWALSLAMNIMGAK